MCLFILTQLQQFYPSPFDIDCVVYEKWIRFFDNFKNLPLFDTYDDVTTDCTQIKYFITFSTTVNRRGIKILGDNIEYANQNYTYTGLAYHPIKDEAIA